MSEFVTVTFKFKDKFETKRFDKKEPSQLYCYLSDLEEEKKDIYGVDLDYDGKIDNEIKAYTAIINSIEINEI